MYRVCWLAQVEFLNLHLEYFSRAVPHLEEALGHRRTARLHQLRRRQESGRRVRRHNLPRPSGLEVRLLPHEDSKLDGSRLNPDSNISNQCSIPKIVFASEYFPLAFCVTSRLLTLLILASEHEINLVFLNSCCSFFITFMNIQ